MGTGYYYNGTQHFQKDLWEYDPTANSWVSKANIPGGNRVWGVGCALNGKGYVGTGSSSGTGPTLVDLWEFSPTANTWTQKADFAGSAREYAVSFSIGNKGYMGTGDDVNFSTDDLIGKWDVINFGEFKVTDSLLSDSKIYFQRPIANWRMININTNPATAMPASPICQVDGTSGAGFGAAFSAKG